MDRRLMLMENFSPWGGSPLPLMSKTTIYYFFETVLSVATTNETAVLLFFHLLHIPVSVQNDHN